MVKKTQVDLKTLTHEELLRVAEELRRQVSILTEEATTDPLTGVANRRAFDRALLKEQERVKRGMGKPLSLAILDIDHFKKVNDTFGHEGGDAVLRGLGAFLTKQVRQTDFVARFGGEEFIIVLPKTSKSEARKFLGRLRKKLVAEFEATVVEGGTTRTIKVTASFGLATWNEKESPDAFWGRADKALYRAKEGGRNRVRSAR